MMSFRKSLGFFLALSLCLLSGKDCFAVDVKQAETLMETANGHFENQNFEEAIEVYAQLVEQGFISLPLFHNLSLAYYEENKLGKSILFMERAKRLSPYDRDVKKNLQLLKENIQGDSGNLPDFFLKAWYKGIVQVFGSRVWLILHLLFLFGGIFLLYHFLLKGMDLGLHSSYIKGIIIGTFVLSLLFGAFSYSRSHLQSRSDEGIIINDNVVLRIAAESNSQEVSMANQGIKVIILDQINDFLKVKMPDFTEVWINSADVVII